MPKRCPNGTRRNRSTKECVPWIKKPRTRCPNGTRRNRLTKECEPWIKKPRTRCPNGTRRNRSTKECESWHKKKTLASSVKTKKAKKAIQKFIVSRRSKITARFLHAVCGESGICIAFGKEIQKINRFFRHFVSFDYVSDRVKLINSGKNGFIQEIPYLKEGYKAHAILKSSKTLGGDNLVYEYLVGKQINRWMTQFPCFLETYGMFRYASPTLYEDYKNKRLSQSHLKTDLIPMQETDPYFIQDSCRYSLYLCVLIQHIHNARTVEDHLQKTVGYHDYLLYAMYQIYMPLAALGHLFTHYDLHTSNVILYEPNKIGYIQYHYHLRDGSVTRFKSKYLAKIIDYGRCYFQDSQNPENNSMAIYDQVCAAAKECGGNRKNKTCGYSVGYSILNDEQKPGSFYFMTSQKPNISHDLRLLNILRHDNKPTRLVGFRDFLQSVHYSGVYGTKERKSEPLSGKIYNVRDAFARMNELILMEENQAINEALHVPFEKIGDLHIYTDGRNSQFTEA